MYFAILLIGVSVIEFLHVYTCASDFFIHHLSCKYLAVAPHQNKSIFGFLPKRAFSHFINLRTCAGLWYLSCLSVSQLVTVTLRWPLSNSHNSETTSSIATKRQRDGKRCILRHCSTQKLMDEREARKVMEMGRLFKKKCGDNTIDLHVRTKVPDREMNKHLQGTTCKLFVGKLP